MVPTAYSVANTLKGLHRGKVWVLEMRDSPPLTHQGLPRPPHSHHTMLG